MFTTGRSQLEEQNDRPMVQGFPAERHLGCEVFQIASESFKASQINKACLEF